MNLTDLTLAIAEARDEIASADAAVHAMPSPPSNRDAEATQTIASSLTGAVEKLCGALEQFAQDVANELAALSAPVAPTTVSTTQAAVSAPPTVSTTQAPATAAP